MNTTNSPNCFTLDEQTALAAVGYFLELIDAARKGRQHDVERAEGALAQLGFDLRLSHPAIGRGGPQ
jgi:hypothetical protein